MSAVLTRPLDPTPGRPEQPIRPVRSRLTVACDIDIAHLANPQLAVSRLLNSEADAFAHVTGDEERLIISIALPDARPETLEQAEGWIRWAVHNAGIRGTCERLD